MFVDPLHPMTVAPMFYVTSENINAWVYQVKMVFVTCPKRNAMLWCCLCARNMSLIRDALQYSTPNKYHSIFFFFFFLTNPGTYKIINIIMYSPV